MTTKRRKSFKCSSEAQKKAIRRSYAIRSKKAEDLKPQKFPFWARLAFEKKRTTLVIDEDMVYDKQKKRIVPGYVNREATHTPKDEYLKLEPNPDRTDPEPMYLKRPSKKPKYMFRNHNKELDMPEILIDMYDKNNKKDK